MGEKKRKQAAEALRFSIGDTEVVAFGRDVTSPHSLPPVEGAAAMVCEIGHRRDLTRQVCRDAADWMAGALETQPGLMLIVTLGGFDTDPREVRDIPEAMQAFRWFGERLRELDEGLGQPRLLNRMESVTRKLILIAMGLAPATTLVTSAKGDPVLQAQHDADALRVRMMDAAYRAADIAAAKGGQRQ